MQQRVKKIKMQEDVLMVVEVVAWCGFWYCTTEWTREKAVDIAMDIAPHGDVHGVR